MAIDEYKQSTNNALILPNLVLKAPNFNTACGVGPNVNFISPDLATGHIRLSVMDVDPVRMAWYHNASSAGLVPNELDPTFILKMTLDLTNGRLGMLTSQPGTTLDVRGGTAWGYRTVTDADDPVAVAETDRYLRASNAAVLNFDLMLASTVPEGFTVDIYKASNPGAARDVDVNPAGSDTIDDVAGTDTISGKNENRTYVSNGVSNWETR